MTLTTSQLRLQWSSHRCQPSRYTVVYLHPNPDGTRARLFVDALCADAFRALDDVAEHHHYDFRVADTGAYNCRLITGGTNWSLHAYGIAADLNWLTNPYGPVLRTDMPRAMVADILAIRTIDGRQVFRWGGTYSGNKDAMHYEVVLTPAQIARGIDWSTVAGHSPPMPPPGPPMPPPEDSIVHLLIGAYA